MAQYVLQKFHEYGIADAAVQNVSVLLSYPTAAPQLRLLGGGSPPSRSVVTSLDVAEKVLPQDPTSNTHWRTHVFHGYSPSGDVTGELVYANFGLPADLDFLNQKQISLQNKIVLVRYGRCFRGLKVRNAQQRGARAVLIYSDPAEDGYAQGSEYPEGPWRPSFGIQRGSVQFNSLCAGDPARVSSNRSVVELCGYSTNELIPQIPSLPISYGVARQLFEQALKTGSEAPDSFRGALNVTYRLGPSGRSGYQVRVTVGFVGKERGV